MRHDVTEDLYFDDHDGPVHAEEAAAVLTIGDKPIVVAEGVRHRHLRPLTEGDVDWLDMASMWIDRQLHANRVVLIRAPHRIDHAVCVAANVLLDDGIPADDVMAHVTPQGVKLEQWMRDLLMI